MDVGAISPTSPKGGNQPESIKMELIQALGQFSKQIAKLSLTALNDPKELQKIASTIIQLNNLTKPLVKDLS